MGGEKYLFFTTGKIQLWVYSTSEPAGLGIPRQGDVPAVTAQGHPPLGSQDLTLFKEV